MEEASHFGADFGHSEQGRQQSIDHRMVERGLQEIPWIVLRLLEEISPGAMVGEAVLIEAAEPAGSTQVRRRQRGEKCRDGASKALHRIRVAVAQRHSRQASIDAVVVIGIERADGHDLGHRQAGAGEPPVGEAIFEKAGDVVAHPHDELFVVQPESEHLRYLPLRQRPEPADCTQLLLQSLASRCGCQERFDHGRDRLWAWGGDVPSAIGLDNIVSFAGGREPADVVTDRVPLDRANRDTALPQIEAEGDVLPKPISAFP